MYIIKKLRHFLVLTTLLLVSVCGCNKKPEASGSDVNTSSTNTLPGQVTADANNSSNSSLQSSKPQDKPLADFQIQLIDQAFNAASSIPKMPHLKDRCSAQKQVVDACLKLGQPVRAARYADNIDNWQRGLCYAEIAFYLAQNGYTIDQIQGGLELAEKIAAMDHGQKWRSDRIRAVIAKTYTLLGKPEKAKQFSENLESSEAPIKGTDKLPFDQMSFEEQIKTLETIIPLTDFELTKQALSGYADLFNHYYEDIEKRNIAEEKMKTMWEKVKIPLPIRLDLLTVLIDTALNHSDRHKALELVNEMQAMLKDYQWPTENFIPLSAKEAEFRYKAGDQAKAIADAEAALTFYNEKEPIIPDFIRAETIRPLAETYQSMGNTKAALSVYQKAVEVGNTNPNIKPRAEDMAATCSSMALYAVEPDAALWTRIHEIAKGFGNP